MEIILPLDEMTMEEKLCAMEQIWADLCRNEADLRAPAWHGDVLEAREARAKAGPEHFTDWEEAKRRIRDALQTA